MRKFRLVFCLAMAVLVMALSTVVFAQANSVQVRDAIFTYDANGNVTISRDGDIGKYLYDEFLEAVGGGYRVTSIKVLQPIYAIEANTFASSYATLREVDLPSSVYRLEENIFGEEHNVKVRFAGNEALWQDMDKANDESYYGSVELYSRGYASIGDARFSVTEDGLEMELVYGFVARDCVAEVEIYSYDANDNKIPEVTHTIYLYDDGFGSINSAEDFIFDYTPDGRTHWVDITIYNNLTDRVQWGDVFKTEFFAYNTPVAVESAYVDSNSSALTCYMEFAFVREDAVAHVEVFDYNSQGDLTLNNDMVISIPEGTTYLERNIPFKYDNADHFVKITFYDNMTDKSEVADPVTYEFYAYQEYNGFEYEYIDDNSVIITKHVGYLDEEVIPSAIAGYAVTDIGENAFDDNGIYVETILIPDTITKIGKGAFRGCTNLTKVNYTGSQEKWNSIIIGEDNTPLLTSEIVFDYVAPIYANYYYDQYEGMLYIELENCFSPCVAEIEIINVSKTESEKLYFTLEAGTQYKEVAIPGLNYGDTYKMRGSIMSSDKSVRYTRPYEFAYFMPYDESELYVYNGDMEYRINSNNEVEIVVYYGEAEQLVIPDEIDGLPVTTLDNESLSDTNIVTLTLGKNMRRIGEGALTYCYSLENIIIDSANPYLTFEDGVLYDKNKTSIIRCLYNNTNNHFDMPDSVISIGPGAFEGVGNLQTIRFSANLKKVGRNAFSYSRLGGEIVLPEGVEAIGSQAFNCEISKVYIPSTTTYIAEDAFYRAEMLADITVDEDSASYIAEDGVLYDKSKTALIKYPSAKVADSFTIPATVKEISSYALYDGIGNLSKITIPKSVKVIKESAFGYRWYLDQIDYLGTEQEWNEIEVDNYNDVLYGAQINFVGAGDEDEDEDLAEGRCGDNAFWKIDSEGVLTIYGTGDLYEWSGSNYIPWYEKSFSKVVVENGIGKISAESFGYYPELESVVLAESVTYIGAHAFAGSANLKSFTATHKLTYIGESAFHGCSSLENVSNTQGVTYIGSNAFYDCISLRSIDFPGAVTHIGEFAFYNCSSLEGAITIPATVTSFGGGVFGGCAKITELTFSAPVAISDGAFSGCEALEKVAISSGVTGIGSNSFSYCINLKSVSIPGTVSGIGAFAFGGCKDLTTLTISKGVKTIGDRAFEDCESITSISIPSSVMTIGERAFMNCTSAQLTIAEGVTAIGKEAFIWCTGITQLTIPSSVTSIGESAFSACKGMTKATIPSSVTNLGIDAFALCSSLETVTLDAKIYKMEMVFRDCTNLREITLPDTLVYIGDGTFNNCTALADLEFPSGLTHIGEYAFANSGLGMVTIPETVVQVGESAFYNCDNLKLLDWQARQPVINEYTFSDCDSLEIVIFGIHLKEIGKSAFEGCEGLKELIIPGNIHTIRESAFKHCRALESLILQEGVTTIEDYGFSVCTGLKQIMFPKSLEYIGWEGFEFCDNVTDVYYAGTETAWQNIYMSGLIPFVPPTKIHYNYKEITFPDPNTNVNIDGELTPGYIPEKINEVTINEKGTACGRFLVYTADGTDIARNCPVTWSMEGTNTAWEDRTDEHGYITVSFFCTKSGEYRFKFRGEYIQDFEGIVKATVEPLHFESGFEAICSGGVSVGMGLGVGAEVAGFGAEAKLGSVGLKGSKAIGFAFSQEHVNGKNKLTTSSSVNSELAVYGKVGLFAEVSKNDIPGITVSAADTSGEAALGNIVTIGYENDDFSLKDKEDITGLAKFLIVSAVQNNLSNLLAEYVAEQIDAPVNYFERGYSVSLKAGENVGLIEVAGGFDTKIALHGASGKTAWTNTTQKYKDKSQLYTTSFQYEGESRVFDVSVGWNETEVPITLFRRLNSQNVSVSAKENSDGGIESYALALTSTDIMGLPFGTQSTKEVRNFEFDGNGAIMIANDNDALRYFGQGNKAFFTLPELKSAATTMIKTPFPGKYTTTKSVSTGSKLDLSASFDVGVELGVEFGLEGYYNYSYEKDSGIIENGVVYMQSYNEIDDLVKENILTPKKIVDATKAKIKELINEVLEKVESWVDETGKTVVAKGKAIAKSIKKTGKKYKLYISSVAEEMGISYVLAVREKGAEKSTSSIATTIGSPYVVSMVDEDGALIGDFSDEPLSLEIAYTEEDLAKAGVTDVGMMSVLYWDDDKKVYVNMGGVLDTAEQKMTLDIIRSGQYILGADNREPAITLFSQDHTGKNPVVSAYVSDMSGIDYLRLDLDGETIVNMANLENYYDHTTGLLKYATTLDRGGEYIFTIYARDTFGNDITQDYSVVVYDDVPAIDDVKVLGKTADQAETVTATIDGESITSVYLNTFVRMASGEAYQLCVDMVKEDGVYTAKVPVIENASVAEIWVSAFNSFGNSAESERQICLVDSESTPTVYIHSIMDGDVNVECANINENGQIYLAVYDAQGAVVDVYKKAVSEDTVTFEKIAEGDSLKVFAWKEGVSPISKPFTANIK